MAGGMISTIDTLSKNKNHLTVNKLIFSNYFNKTMFETFYKKHK